MVTPQSELTESGNPVASERKATNKKIGVLWDQMWDSETPRSSATKSNL